MAQQRHADDRTDGRGTTGTALKRRGILAAAGIAVAGLVAKQAAQPVAASATMVYATGGTLVTNIADGQTELVATLTTNTVALNVDASPSANFFDAIGVLGRGSHSGAGVLGLMDGVGYPGAFQNAGVYGIGATGKNGVSGLATGGGTGIYGESYGTDTSYGVFGQSDLGLGVWGSSIGGGTGVYGNSFGAGNGNGVYGVVHHVGTTQVTAGVFGDSDASYGIIGRTTAAFYSGCTGIATTANTSAFAGSGTGGAYAAYFTGPTVVSGNFTVINGQKNAAVKHTDGSYRLLHCVESPEPWFEDFGEAKLVNGKADVKLDPDFAAVVDTSGYMVFLTERDAHNDLFVTKQAAGGFAVQAKAGTPSGGFYYRIVARRKDITVGRLAKFDLPKIRLPKPEEMPPPPPPPKKPS